MGLVFHGVGFDYPQTAVFRDLDLSFGEGITALMGPNGSGKTTLLHLAAGIIAPRRGEIELDGERYPGAAGRVRRSLGLAPQSADFPDHLTPRKLIQYLARIRFLDARLGMEELERLGIGDLADRRLEELSAGEQRLVNVAQALMGAPSFIILDEFSRNLGIEDLQKVSRRLLELAAGRTVIFSTHHCADVETLAHRVILLDGGQAIFSGQPAALVRSAQGHVHALDAQEKPRLAGAANIQVSQDNHDGLRLVGELPGSISGTSVAPTLEEACLWAFSQARKRS